MTRKLLVGAIVAGALTVTGTAIALAQSDGSTPSTASTTTTTDPTSTSTSDDSPTTSETFPTTSSSDTSTSSPTSSNPAPAPGQLSADDAARIVQERLGGTVREVEREVEHGRLEWKVEITARDGFTYDVRVDAATGDFTRVDQDDDRGRGRGGDDDKHGDDDNSGRHGGGDDDRDDD